MTPRCSNPLTNILTRRRGMTLIELLIVVFIVTAMMALLASSIRPALENRKTKEASRVLNAAFAQAKARAMSTGRRVGVWLQGADPLDDPNFNMATEIYIAEEPLPYSGDLETSHALIQNEGNNICWIDTNENALFAMESNEITIGDRIKFNFRGPALPIIYVGPPRNGHEMKFSLPGNFVQIEFVLGGYPTPRGPLAPGLAPSGVNYNNQWDIAGGAPIGSPFRVPYQIFRQPRRVGSAIEMPTGTCVDLRNSGTQRLHEDFNNNGTLDGGEDVNGNGFLDLLPWTSPQDGNPADLTTHEPVPGVEFRLRVNENTPPPPPPPAVIASDPAPATTVVVFAPDGSVASVVRNREHPHRTFHTGVTDWPLGIMRIPETVHFLVGDLSKMNIVTALPYIAGANEPVEINENLVNPASLWVSVNVRTGNVTTANNNWLNAGTFSRSLHAARQFANESQNLGAR